jgi:excinuclease UvrABC nuclease subunit
MAKKKPMRIISNGKHKTHQINFDFDILESGWRTADTYDRDFKPTPEVCGVYFILASDFVYLKPKTIQQIIYVGCSSNLKKRYTNHPVIKNNYRKYSCLQFYFMPDNDYKKSEIALIKKIRPLLNIQHNG